MYLDILNEKVYCSELENSDKPIVVYIHGLGGKASFFENFSSLNRDYRIFAFDLIGRGNSSWNQNLSIDLWLENINLVLDELNINNFYLVSYSFGCYLATKIINSKKYNILDSLFICPYNGFINLNTPFIEKILSIYPKKQLNDNEMKMIYESLNDDVLKAFKIETFEHYCWNYQLLSNFFDKNFYSDEMYQSYKEAGKINILGGKNDPVVPEYSLNKLVGLNESNLTMIDGDHLLVVSSSEIINNKINEMIKK